MTIEYYWTVVIKRWKLLVACVVLVGLGTYIGSRLITPLYQSTALVQVAIQSSTNFVDYNSLLASNQLVQTEAQLATSGSVLREVATHYPGLSVDQLARKATAAPMLNTQIFGINVRDADATRAAKIANDVAATLIKQQFQVNAASNSQSQQQIQHEVDTTRHRIDDLTTQITNLELRIVGVEPRADGQKQVFAALQMQIADLQRQLSRLQEHDSQWEAKLAQFEIAVAQNQSFLRVVQPAQVTSMPVMPQIRINTIAGLAAGLLIGMLWALLLEQLDTRVRTPEDIAQVLDSPIISVIWRQENPKLPKEIFLNKKQSGMHAEAYSLLRTNIGFASVGRPLRSIVITSAVPQDGKSTIASNLAISLAKAGKKTLLIDADLRCPTLHEKFLLAKDAMGLSNAIVDCGRAQSVTSKLLTHTDFHIGLSTYMHSVDIPNLSVMPAGTLPPNPAELLDSSATNAFLAAIVDSEMEMIIFDTPSLLGLADTSILAAKVDGTVVVVDITRVKRKTLQQVKAQLEQSGTHVLGCIVNKQNCGRRDALYPFYYTHNADEEQVRSIPQVEDTPVLVASPSPLRRKHKTM